MRNFILAVTLAFIAAAIGGPTPAAATEAEEAMKLCDAREAKTGDCDYRVEGNGSVNIFFGGCGGTSCNIYCPQVGKCECQRCPGRIQSGGTSVRGPTAGVADALSGPAGPRVIPKGGTTGGALGGGATKTTP